jgi:hypothetical protein
MRKEMEMDDEDFEIVDGRPVLKDGRRFCTPMIAMDELQKAVAGVLHDGLGNPAGYKNGYVFSSNDEAAQAARAEAYAAYDEQLVNAWRNAPSSTPATSPATVDERKDPYSTYDRKLVNAWRDR